MNNDLSLEKAKARLSEVVNDANKHMEEWHRRRIKEQARQWYRGQLMKTILIETVTNGWIARPFSACETWAQGDKSCMAVFTKIEDLQAAIPDLLNPSVFLAGDPGLPKE